MIEPVGEQLVLDVGDLRDRAPDDMHEDFRLVAQQVD